MRVETRREQNVLRTVRDGTQGTKGTKRCPKNIKFTLRF